MEVLDYIPEYWKFVIKYILLEEFINIGVEAESKIFELDNQYSTKHIKVGEEKW